MALPLVLPLLSFTLPLRVRKQLHRHCPSRSGLAPWPTPLSPFLSLCLLPRFWRLRLLAVLVIGNAQVVGPDICWMEPPTVREEAPVGPSQHRDRREVMVYTATVAGRNRLVNPRPDPRARLEARHDQLSPILTTLPPLDLDLRRESLVEQWMTFKCGRSLWITCS